MTRVQPSENAVDFIYKMLKPMDGKVSSVQTYMVSLLISLVLASLFPIYSLAAEANGIVIARIHFNTQTADFEKAREFYRMLGYTEGVSGFPKTNTHLMARSLGMYDLCTYEIDDIEVINIPGAQGTTSIDLIKFIEPFNPDPPYQLPNHLGMAYAALATKDFSNDYALLKQQGVVFLSEPFAGTNGRFVFFQDPEGVYFKLVEDLSNSAMRDSSDQAIDIQAMPYIGINVSDFDASLAFYGSLGYTQIEMLPTEGSLEEALAYGLDRSFKIKSADVTLAGGDGNTLRITQWQQPFNPELAYPAPINHIGINRIALAVADLDSAVSALADQGVEFLSEIAPCCSGTGEDRTGIINALDPDGIFVELVGPIRQRPVQPAAQICTDSQDLAILGREVNYQWQLTNKQSSLMWNRSLN